MAIVSIFVVCVRLRLRPEGVEGLSILTLSLSRQIPVRTGPILADAWIRSLRVYLTSFLNLSLVPPSCPSSPGKHSQSCVSEFFSKILHFFLTPRVHSFRRGLLPGPLGSSHLPPSSEKVCPSPEPTQTRYKILNFYRFASRRLRPGLVRQGAQGLQASAKGTPRPTRILTRPQPQQNSFRTLSSVI